VKKSSFGLLKLEMADLERFWRKTPLGPLGVKTSLMYQKLQIIINCEQNSIFLLLATTK
jgi:hypothetical protein